MAFLLYVKGQLLLLSASCFLLVKQQQFSQEQVCLLTSDCPALSLSFSSEGFPHLTFPTKHMLCCLSSISPPSFPGSLGQAPLS